MGGKVAVLTAVFAVTSIFAATAEAQSHKRVMDVEGAWTHLSGMTFPAELIGYSRKSLVDHSVVAVTDVAAQYESDDGKTTILIYAFRPGVGNSAVLADFSLQWWQSRGATTSPTPTDFVIAGAERPNGWRFTSRLPNFSVASALAQGGGWIFKVTVILRAQPDLNANAVLDRAISSVDWPQSARQATQQPLPQPCSELDQTEQEAAVREQVSLEELNASVTYAREWTGYCRGPWLSESGVYRPINGEKGHIIVRDESGIGFLVHPDETKNNKGFSVILRRAMEFSLFPGFESEPTPAQVVAVVQGQRPVARLTLDSEGALISSSRLGF